MHYPGHLRDAFVQWLDEGRPDTATVEVDYEPRQWAAERLLGRMVHCTDVLPGYAYDELGLDCRQTYGAVAQQLLAERRRATA
jgi:hypothetical protein